MALGDFNGDGKPDLAVTNVGGGTVSVLLNTTATGATVPSFATQVTFLAGADPIAVAVGDFNGDGKSDLVVADYNTNGVAVLLDTTATGATTPIFAGLITFAAGMNPIAVAVGDFNGDGKPDLVTANFNNSIATVLLDTTTTGATTPTFSCT